MSKAHLFDCLGRLSKLGSPNRNTLEYVEKLLTSLKDDILRCPESSECFQEGDADDAKEKINIRIEALVKQLLSVTDDVTKSDNRVVIGCYVLAVLQEIHAVFSIITSGENRTSYQPTDRTTTEKPPALPSLISVQQTKVVEDSLRIVMYTLVLGCLSPDASQYVKVTIARNKFVLGPNLVSVSASCRHGLLTSVMKILLMIMEHASLGVPLRGCLFPEVLNAMLELCFSPGKLKDQPEDTAFFREQLEKVLAIRDPNQALQHLLLLKGIAKNGSWLQKVCGSFIVRRYMMQPNGVAAVIGAGLVICDGQDWKRCEAVAALIAHAKFPNIDLFYSTVGPQIVELVLNPSLKPEIISVVNLVMSELAQRSATLTALHVTDTLLQPLLNLTSHHIVSQKSSSSLTLCITRIHKLFVEVSVPSASLLKLLHPVIDPLMAVAAFPASHLRSLAEQCIIRYLSQQSNEEVIEVLLHVSKIEISSAIPAVNPSVTFSLDEEGGVQIAIAESPSEDKVLEKDENLAKTLVSTLETLKNPTVVRLFYEKLVFYIDFSVLNKKEVKSTVLVTDEDIRAQQFDSVRRVLVSCSLLSNLADSEKLRDDLFQNLSAAVPVVDTLLKTSCQRCDDEALNRTKTSFLLNVLMMVSCYVNEQMLRRKMSSDDWNGLKLLLPSLEEIRTNISDEAILLFVEQLRNIVLTHGVIKVVPDECGEGKNKKVQQKKGLLSKLEKGEENPVHLTKKNTKVHSQKPPSQVCSSVEIQEKPLTLENLKNFSKGDVLNDSPPLKNCSYKEAMEDVVNPVLPIRGHGLLVLSKLIEEQDSETLSHKKQLLSLFQHSLKEEDSYLYLMAIRGLAALCDAYPEKVVEALTQEFSIGHRTAEDRAKLAEALARACKRLGPVLPRHSSHFINSLLSGVRDDESMVRASSLSSLGEVCKMLRFSLGPILYEIFGVLQAVIDGDKAVEVRRAAVLVVTMILQGLGRDAFTVLKDVLRDLYRVLRLVHARDPDDVVRLHTQLAMEEIDAITKEFLLPKLSLTKRIYVADLPPNQFQ